MNCETVLSDLKCHYMHSLEISKTIRSLIFFVRNLVIHCRFTLSGQIFNSHILVEVKNEDFKGGYWNHTNGISIAEDHLTLEAFQFIQFTLFSFCATCVNHSHPTGIADLSSTSNINQQHQYSGDNNVIIGMSWVKNAPWMSAFGLFFAM